MSQIQFDDVYPKKLVYPMIVNFLNGYTTDNFKEQEAMVFENPVIDEKIVATEVDGLLYTGEEESEPLEKTLFLARNRVTGKVRLIEAGMVNLKPILKKKLDKSQLLESSNLELSRKFGSKKEKQRMEQREKLKVNVETVTEQMQNVANEVTEDKLDLSSYNKVNSDDFYIPPVDRTAMTAEEVYDIDKILTEEQYERIHSELHGKDYIADLISFVKSIVSKRSLSPKCTVLAVYANSLLQLNNTMVKEITKKSFTICPHSPTLNDIILNNFLSSSNSKRTRPAPYKDKALCHAIVFLLLINNLKLEMDGLCETLKLSANTASMKIRVTGASVVTALGKKVVQLKLPLNKKTAFRRKSSKF